MGFKSMIRTAILIIVLVIVYAVLVQVKQDETKVGVEQVPGTVGSVLRRAWTAISVALVSSLFTFIIAILLFLYILWKIIKMCVPNFPIPFKLILLSIPPFPDLEKARIFALFDGIFGVILGRGTMGKRLTNFAYIIKDFLQANSSMLYDQMKQNSRSNEDNDSGAGGNFTAAERQMVNDQVQQCIEENTTHVTPDMDAVTTARLNATNMQNKLICELNKLKLYSNLQSGRG